MVSTHESQQSCGFGPPQIMLVQENGSVKKSNDDAYVIFRKIVLQLNEVPLLGLVEMSMKCLL